MNKVIFDILIIITICIFILYHAFMLALSIVNGIEKYKKEKREKQEKIKYNKKHSGYYKIMAPRLDLIDKPAYEYTYGVHPELYYTYGIGFSFRHTMPYRKKGTSFGLLPSEGCSFIEMTQDEYDEFVMRYRINPDLIKAICISAPDSSRSSSIELIKNISKLPKDEYDKFLTKYHITSKDLDIAYKKLIEEL